MKTYIKQPKKQTPTSYPKEDMKPFSYKPEWVTQKEWECAK